MHGELHHFSMDFSPKSVKNCEVLSLPYLSFQLFCLTTLFHARPSSSVPFLALPSPTLPSLSFISSILCQISAFHFPFVSLTYDSISLSFASDSLCFTFIVISFSFLFFFFFLFYPFLSFPFHSFPIL